MFRPETIFFANRKVILLRHHLGIAGQPIAEGSAKQVIARAWDWMNWAELLAVLDTPGAPSPLDEELVGPDAPASAMARCNERVVSQRQMRATCALYDVLGLPMQLCISLGGFLRLTGRHAAGNAWLLPEEYRSLYTDAIAPKTGFAAELLSGLRDAREKPSSFPLPPFRPR